MQKTRMECANYSAGIKVSLGTGCLINKSPWSGAAQVALLLFLLGVLTCLDLFRGTMFS